MRKEKAITLISLVVTIIILIILASMAIYLGLSNNGIFKRAKKVEEETNKQTATEILNLKITTVQMNKYAEKQEMPTLQELADVLYEDNEIQYVTLESKIADKEKVIVGNKTSIYTKLNNYPYEFEINASLQLASIDGVKLANTNNTNQTMKVLFDGEMSNGTITFEENKIDDYNYYEFIFGIRGIETSESRIFSQIVSKEYLKIPIINGGYRYISSLATNEACVGISITNIGENSITFSVAASGNSWKTEKAHIYKIIGRNI